MSNPANSRNPASLTVDEFITQRLDELQSKTGGNWIGTHLHELRFEIKADLNSTDTSPDRPSWVGAFGRAYEQEIENIADMYNLFIDKQVAATRKLVQRYRTALALHNLRVAQSNLKSGVGHSLLSDLLSDSALAALFGQMCDEAKIWDGHPDYKKEWRIDK